MPIPLNIHGVATLINQDIAWLMRQPKSLERDHIRDILHDYVRHVEVIHETRSR